MLMTATSENGQSSVAIWAGRTVPVREHHSEAGGAADDVQFVTTWPFGLTTTPELMAALVGVGRIKTTFGGHDRRRHGCLVRGRGVWPRRRP
jgi:hypothetical protein